MDPYEDASAGKYSNLALSSKSEEKVIKTARTTEGQKMQKTQPDDIKEIMSLSFN